MKMPTLVLTGAGFLTQASNGWPVETRWADVEEVRAFKIDLLTTDEVRFVFVLSTGARVEISEEQPGFEAVLEAAQVHFPSVARWWDRVVKPAFERNETILFRRNAVAG